MADHEIHEMPDLRVLQAAVGIEAAEYGGWRRCVGQDLHQAAAFKMLGDIEPWLVDDAVAGQRPVGQDIAVVGMIQLMGSPWPLRNELRVLTNSALTTTAASAR